MVLFHFDLGAVPGGFVGVDVFFVISGFLITRNIVQDLEAGRFSLADFYYRRIRRLFPALLFTVLMTSVFAIALFSAEHLQRYSASAIYAIFSLSNVFFWTEAGYFDTSAAFKPLLHFWSLAVEEQFYLAWPLLLLVFFRSHRAVVIALGLLACGALSTLAATRVLVVDPAAAFYLTPFRILEFSLGAVCVWVSVHRLRAWHRELLFSAGLALVLISALVFTEHTPFPGWNAFWPCLGAAMIIACSECRSSRWLLGNPVAVRFGLISYSLYLVHWPMWVFYSYWKRLPVMTYQALMVLVVAIGTAFLMHRYIERPFRVHGHAAPWPSGPRFFTGTAMVVALIVIPALHAWQTGGWNWRAPEPLLADVALADMNCRRAGGRSYEVLCEIRAADRTGPRVLVIGDSHADHLETAMRYLAARHRFDVDFWTHRGCPPLAGSFRLYGEESPPYEETCRSLTPRWMAAIDTGVYDIVVLAARWMSLFESEHYAGEILRRDYLADRLAPVADTEMARALFDERLRETLQRIHRSGAAAVVFSQVPLLGRDIEACSDESWLFGTDAPLAERCDPGVDYAQQLARLRFTDSVIRSVAGPATLTIVYSDWLCGRQAGQCATVIQGRGLYRDTHHFGDEGSYLLALEYEDLLADFLHNRLQSGERNDTR